MKFEQFKTEAGRLAKRQGKGHLVPDANALFVLWEQGKTPTQVVQNLGATNGNS